MKKLKKSSKLISDIDKPTIHIAHKIRLYPNNKQITYFNKTMGCARFAYNWGLNEWKRLYELGEKPNASKIRKAFNAIRRERFLFTYEVAKSATNQAILNLGEAYLKYFKGLSDYPKFKRYSHTNGSFYLDGYSLKFKETNPVTGDEIRGSYVLIPKLGYVRMAEKLRFNGKINSCVVSKRAGAYYISFSMEISRDEYERTHSYASKNNKELVCGVDIGSKSAITLDNGYSVKPPKPLSKANKRYLRACKDLSRKIHKRFKGDLTKSSNNHIKGIKRLAKIHDRIANIRQDFNHKQTTKVVDSFKFISMETLNVTGMVKNRKMAKSVTDVSYSDISTKLEYKALNSKGYIYYADIFYPSSKICSNCGSLKRDLKLNDRVYLCKECDISIDRDVNAAINLKELMVKELVGIAHPDFKPAERRSMDDRSLYYLRSTFSMKQEATVKSIKAS